MSIKTITTWTCQRCGAQEKYDATRSRPMVQPTGWARVLTVMPPLGSCSDLGLIVADCICRSCVSELRGFLHLDIALADDEPEAGGTS